MPRTTTPPRAVAVRNAINPLKHGRMNRNLSSFHRPPMFTCQSRRFAAFHVTSPWPNLFVRQPRKAARKGIQPWPTRAKIGQDQGPEPVPPLEAAAPRAAAAATTREAARPPADPPARTTATRGPTGETHFPIQRRRARSFFRNGFGAPHPLVPRAEARQGARACRRPFPSAAAAPSLRPVGR